MTSMGTRMAAALAAGAMAVAGCGGGDDEPNAKRFDGEEKQVAAVVDRLSEAARRGDAKTICEDLITRNLQISVRTAAGTSCAQEFTENIASEDTRYEIDDITLQQGGRSATASVTDQDDRKSDLVLQRERDGWRIARIG